MKSSTAILHSSLFIIHLALFASGCRSVVRLPAGDVVLTETKVIGPEMSGTVFTGAADGSTRVIGGVEVKGWTDRGDGVWAAKAPEFTECLFVNGRRAKRAKYPEEGFFKITSCTQIVDRASRTGYRTFVTLPREAADLLAGLDSTELEHAQLLAHVKWDVNRYPLASAKGGLIALEAEQQRTWKAWTTNDFFVLENVRKAFRKPGEWFYDAKAKEILYRPLPGEKIASAVIPHQGLETLVHVKGAKNVAFENLTFAYSAPVTNVGPSRLGMVQAAAYVTSAAVIVDRSAGIEFRGCRFEHLGSYAVWFREGVRGAALRDCELTDLGAGGVRIGVLEYPNRPKANQKLPDGNSRNVPYVETAPWMTSHVTVENCLLAHGGRFHPAGVGILLTHASDCVLTHNDVFDFYYTGVSLGWIWGYAGSASQRNELSFCHIHDIGQNRLADMGGVYTLGTSFGTRIFNNVIHGIHSYSYGGWGLYNDEGSQGIVWENNLVYDTDDASYHQHYGIDNVVRNNVLLDSKAGQVAVSRPEPHRSITCERNVILWTAGDAFNRYGGTKEEKAKIDWRSNLWWRTDGKELFNGTSFKEWCARVKDEGSVFADPGFTDWKHGDITLRPDSPALKLGFKPFDPSLAGRRK